MKKEKYATFGLRDHPIFEITKRKIDEHVDFFEWENLKIKYREYLILEENE